MGAIKREMNNAKVDLVCNWLSDRPGLRRVLCIYQLGGWFETGSFGIGTAAAIILVALFIYLINPGHIGKADSLNVGLKSQISCVTPD